MGKVPVVYNDLSSNEQKIYPTISVEENCIQFDFQTDGNYYVDLRKIFLAFKLKPVKGRGYETYNTKEIEKVKKEGNEWTEAENDFPFPVFTRVNSIWLSVVSTVEVYINNQLIYNSSGFYTHKSYISNKFNVATFEYKRILPSEGNDSKECLEEKMGASLSEWALFDQDDEDAGKDRWLQVVW